jgi:HlyD family secretion protein
MQNHQIEPGVPEREGIGSRACTRRDRLRERSVLVGLALVFDLALPGCTHKGNETEPTVAIQVAPVRRTTIQRRVAADAVLFPLNQAAITPKISAPVRQFYVNRGSRVRKGQLLAVLENRDLAAAAVENKGGYRQAQASYETTTRASVPEEVQKAELDAKAAKENLDAQQKIYDSRKVLFEQGALPRKDLDQAGVTLTQARNQYEIAQKHLEALQSVSKQQELKAAAGQLEAAKGKYLGAEAQLQYSEIRSPINGVVTDRPLYPGEMASAGTPLITVMDLSQVIARTHISQQEAVLLRPGNPVVLSLSASTASSGVSSQGNPSDKGDKPDDDLSGINGKVTLVSPALDPNSTTVEVWVQVPNRDGRLKPGSSVRVDILAETVPNALVVPAAAVLTVPNGGTSVMVVGPDDRAHQRSVHTGIRQGDDIQIADGLKEGERVVTVGAYGLPDNTKVHIEMPQENP